MSFGLILLGFAIAGIMFNKKGNWLEGALEGLMIPFFILWMLLSLFLVVMLSPLLLVMETEKFNALARKILPF